MNRLLPTHVIHAFSLQHPNIFLYCLISCICFSFLFFPPPGSSANHLLIMFSNNQFSHLASGHVPTAPKAERELLPRLTLLQHHLPGLARVTGPLKRGARLHVSPVIGKIPFFCSAYTVSNSHVVFLLQY